jgi:transcriptional regulator with XRE-family HTH domain
MELLGSQIRSARAAAELSVRAAAEAAGLAKSHYQRLEAGQVAAPSPATLRAVAVALGCSYELLIEAAGYS